MIVNRTVKDAAEREARLPKWAQHELTLLRQRLADAHRTIDAQRGDKSRVQVDPHGIEGKPDLYLPDRVRVRFMLGDDWQDHLDVHLDKHPRRGWMLRAQGGRLAISVHPEAGNVVSLKLEH